MKQRFFTAKTQIFMFKNLDKFWFLILASVNRWTIRQGEAHCRRERERRFRRVLADGHHWKN
jgi:hypothetical protein